ncbi:MAG TPA: glycosyltransferase family 4 protein [Candidatus Binatia bacterium]|nr:glycosyltransferase family 4 protein [Candidatus Binatia bacterium]
MTGGDAALLLTPHVGFPTSLERDLLRLLPDCGFRPVLATARPADEDGPPGAVTTVVLPGLADARTGRSLLRLPATLARLARVARHHRVRIVHSLRGSTTISALLLSRFLGIPHVCHVRFQYEDPARYQKLWLDRADCVVTVSWAALQALLAACRRRRPAIARAILNGIDAPGFRAMAGEADVRAALGIAREDFVAGFVGSLDERKDPLTLIRAAALLGDRRLVVLLVGRFRTAAYEAAFRAEIERLGLDGRCHLIGYQPNPSAFFRAMDVLVLPTTGDALPRVVLEAMAHGRPVVASAVGGVPELVVHGRTGLLAAAGNAPAFAEALGALLADRALAETMGRAGRQRVEEEFRVERTVKAIADLYRERLGRPR